MVSHIHRFRATEVDLARAAAGRGETQGKETNGAATDTPQTQPWSDRLCRGFRLAGRRERDVQRELVSRGIPWALVWERRAWGGGGRTIRRDTLLDNDLPRDCSLTCLRPLPSDGGSQTPPRASQGHMKAPAWVWQEACVSTWCQHGRGRTSGWQKVCVYECPAPRELKRPRAESVKAGPPVLPGTPPERRHGARSLSDVCRRAPTGVPGQAGHQIDGRHKSAGAFARDHLSTNLLS